MIAANRRRGKWTGGTPILGYDVDRTGPSPKLAVNAAEAARVREIFALYLKHGSLLPVVDELFKSGWLNKAWRTKAGEPMGGRPFDKCSLYALLTNPLYVGKVRHKTNVYLARSRSRPRHSSCSSVRSASARARACRTTSAGSFGSWALQRMWSRTTRSISRAGTDLAGHIFRPLLIACKHV